MTAHLPPYYWTPDSARPGRRAHAYPGAWSAPNTVRPIGPPTRALCGRRPAAWPHPDAYASALLCGTCARIAGAEPPTCPPAVTCPICGGPAAACTFERACRCWYGRPCRTTYTVRALAGIPLAPPVSFTAPADATDAELERAAVDAMLSRP